MKKIFTFLILSILIATEANSQNYRQAAGLRLGAASGITYRRVFGADVAGEVMLLGQNHGTSLVFLFEKQKPAVLFDDLNMNFIYGIGAHIGGANTDYYYYDDPHGYNYYHVGYNTLQLGIDGFASFEYLIPRYPIALSLETKPYFEFFDNHSFGIHLFVIAFGARYTF
jgi:hypothetical protein